MAFLAVLGLVVARPDDALGAGRVLYGGLSRRAAINPADVLRSGAYRWRLRAVPVPPRHAAALETGHIPAAGAQHHLFLPRIRPDLRHDRRRAWLLDHDAGAVYLPLGVRDIGDGLRKRCRHRALCVD